MKKENTNKSAFAELMRNYETATTDERKSIALQALAKACTYSVLKKLIDPQSKNTDGKATKNGNGCNPAILKLKKSLYADTLMLDTLNDVNRNGNGCTTRYDTNGNLKNVITDKSAHDRYNAAVDRFIDETISDGYDLIQVAIVALLEQSKKVDTTVENWLEKTYTKKALSRKVYINTADADKEWITVETTPIQEVFKAIRRYVMNNRSVNIDPCCKYVYLSELAIDPENDDTAERIYRRLPRYNQSVDTDIHVDRNGNVTMTATIKRNDIDVMDDMLSRLNLTTKESAVIKYCLQGYGHKVIANSLQITENAVKGCIHRIRDKARKEFNVDL